MAVASDLPDLENRQIYNGARNSVIYDVNGKRRIGLITGRQNQVLVGYDQISPAMRNAIVAIEDKRFYENRGIDIRGIGRALYQDVLNKQTRVRAARRSPSSSSRTRCRPSRSARSSRSCARRRSPTT